MIPSENIIRVFQPELELLYGAEAASDLAGQILEIIEQFRPRLPDIQDTRLGGQLSERDAVLITYADQVQEEDVAPLQTLTDFCEQHLSGVMSAIHILPFFPSSSDDGFSVIDYRRVDPELGDWQMLERLRDGFALMTDAVINHVSSQSAWFQAFLRDDPRYRDYFITVEGSPDLSQVVRPRTLPLLTTVDAPEEPKAVWTTFSSDQVDLNYTNPAVLLEIIDILLHYVSNGAELIRLDAIAYLWKEVGTTCIHLPQTHAIIRLIRAILDQAAPYVFLITETNVPHRENISYFGNGRNEAQLIYNFALPPLVLHTFSSGNSQALSLWASSLDTPSDRTQFFNFLASHDGIGVNPVREILSASEIDRIVTRVQKHGGLISYKHNPDGSQSPYELNISYFDALSDPVSAESPELQTQRFAAAHAILCALPGTPGIYFHSLFGSRSWPEGVQETGRNRTINREKIPRRRLEQALSDHTSLRSQVFKKVKRLLQVRSDCQAFHPHGGRRIEEAGPGIFALWRFAPDGSGGVFCLHNISGVPEEVQLSGFDNPPQDLIEARRIHLSDGNRLLLKPYQFVWLTQ